MRAWSSPARTWRRRAFTADRGRDSPGAQWAWTASTAYTVPPVLESWAAICSSVTARVRASWGTSPWAVAVWPAPSRAVTVTASPGASRAVRVTGTGRCSPRV